MADTLDIVSLTEAKSGLNITASDTSQDTELASYITAVSRRLDAIVGHIVARTNTNELHDGGCYYIRPKQTPVSSIVTLTEYTNTTSQVLAAETNTTKTANDYLVVTVGRHGSYIYRRSNNADKLFPSGRQNVALTYQSGRYAATSSVDALFKESAITMLVNLWRTQQGMGSQTFGELPTGPTGLPTFAVPNVVVQLLADELLLPLVA